LTGLERIPSSDSFQIGAVWWVGVTFLLVWRIAGLGDPMYPLLRHYDLSGIEDQEQQLLCWNP
jgi:hypothetical protein